MTTSGEEPQERPTPRPGSYGEIAPGVPKYGQYAPAGWEPPQQVGDAQNASMPQSALSSATAYPGYQGPLQGKPTAAGAHLAPPKTVLVSIRLIQLAGVLQLLSTLAIALVLFVPSLRDVAVNTLQAATAGDPAIAALYQDPAMMNALLYTAFVLSVLASVLYLYLAKKIRRGANWARITSMVLALISLLALGQPNVLAIIQIALGVIAVILLFRSPGKEFFLSQKSHRP